METLSNVCWEGLLILFSIVDNVVNQSPSENSWNLRYQHIYNLHIKKIVLSKTLA